MPFKIYYFCFSLKHFLNILFQKNLDHILIRVHMSNKQEPILIRVRMMNQHEQTALQTTIHEHRLYYSPSIFTQIQNPDCAISLFFLLLSGPNIPMEFHVRGKNII